ncbi:MAG: CoA ester lyase [Alphaproteobacteria bacterium]|jgi:citrate lyase beta subunit|nr:CoA ester lyase [Alphaproteobacteria bacterium]MBU2125609.1 CoA ester lyase [Alphaproteobacteria bacterium]MBU2208398.1 CoA ester lyase [Alphaproteobacteria bacterium]MBU2290361.1 CoA ester lyase [Alphaproteobacteria bacterium]
MQLTRSVLYLPASNPRAIEKARGLNADAVILDLEDAVALDAKAEARQAAAAALKAGGFGPRVGVRINGLGTPWGADDLAALGDLTPDFVVAPKIESPESVREVAARLSPGVALWIMIETPLSVLRLDAIAGAGAPLAALMLGINDFGEQMNLVLGPDRDPLKPWLAAVVAAARGHGLLAIDGVVNATDDADRLRTECLQGRAFGFDGKSLIHPAQIDAANAAFSPSPEEVARAREVVAAFASAEADGKGAIRVGYRMVERLHLDAACRLLARHDAANPGNR